MQKNSMYLIVVGIVIILILFMVQSNNDKAIVMNPGNNQTAAKAPAGGAKMDNESVALREHLREIEALQMGLISAEADLVENPKSINALIEKGNCFFDLGRIYKQGNPEIGIKSYEAAADAYHKALDQNPNNVDVMVDLGICYRESGKSETAIDYFKKALELNPKHINAAFNIGIVELFDHDDKAAAVAAWEKFLEIAPNDPRAEDVRNRVNLMKDELSGQE